MRIFTVRLTRGKRPSPKESKLSAGNSRSLDAMLLMPVAKSQRQNLKKAVLINNLQIVY